MVDKFYIVLSVAVAVYTLGSKLLFDQVYSASKTVVDELFHIPQGIAYCQNNFTYWNPKITTLPGLYLVSSSFASTFFECNIYYLRLVNLVASCVNLCLFASILRFIYGYGSDSDAKIVLQAMNLALLPPLYFFSHLYYTDTLSVMFILAFFRLCLVNEHRVLIVLFAVCSIMMRQTNIVWVAMVLGHKLFDIFIKTSRVYGNKRLNKPPISPLNKNTSYMEQVDNSKLKRYYDIFDLYIAFRHHILTCFLTYFRAFTAQDWKITMTHFSVILGFLIFVLKNGSIVVGDKNAHTVSLHLPQMFYFLLFYGVFGLPYVLNSFFTTVRLALNNKAVTLALVVSFLIIVKYNTIVHPYLLADNRHYTFYIWNRWFGKYWFAKYAMIPAYVFLFFNLFVNIKDQNCISFLLPYTICAFAALGLQKMIEVRYFLIPYLVLRLRFARPSLLIVICELVWYLLINVAVYYVFLNKTFMWSDFKDPQRIIW